MPAKLPMSSDGRNVLWCKIPGFEKWFKGIASKLNNNEVIAAIHEKYGVNVTVAVITSLRRTYKSPSSHEAKVRAYAQRDMVVKVKKPELKPTEKMELDDLTRKVRSLESRQTLYEMIGEKVIRAVHNLPDLNIPTRSMPKEKKSLEDEEMVMLISDVQAGLKVDEKESGGLGSFGINVLLDELQYMKEATTRILRYHPNVKTLNIFFLGDIVEGETIFGGQLREIEFGVIQQVMFCWKEFSDFVAHFAGKVNRVNCWGVIGNHGRIGMKGVHSPMSNFDYLLYRMWEERLKPVGNVRWRVAESWWDIAEIQGWKFLLVHGDDTGMGWAGIPFYAVVRHKTRYRELFKYLAEQFGDFDYMVAGHHSIAAQFNQILLNGSWPGGTEFSLKRLQLGDIPSQKLFGVHRRHGVTWVRDINLRALRYAT